MSSLPSDREFVELARAVVELAEKKPGPGVEFCRRLLDAHQAGQRGLPLGALPVMPERHVRAVEKLRLSAPGPQLQREAAAGSVRAKAELKSLEEAEAEDAAAEASA